MARALQYVTPGRTHHARLVGALTARPTATLEERLAMADHDCDEPAAVPEWLELYRDEIEDRQARVYRQPMDRLPALLTPGIRAEPARPDPSDAAAVAFAIFKQTGSYAETARRMGSLRSVAYNRVMAYKRRAAIAAGLSVPTDHAMRCPRKSGGAPA